MRRTELAMLVVALTVGACAAQDPQTQLFHLLAAMDAPLRLLYPEHDSLEDVFLRATEEG